MPARYRHRRPKKGPHRRRRIRPNNRRLANRVPNGASPVAKKHLVRLKYADLFSFSMLTLTAQQQAFNMNSVFDPDKTGVGHQPYGYDQLAALFNAYRVYKFKWHLEFAGANDRLHITVLPINGTAIGTGTQSALAEQPLAVTKAMSFSGGFPVKFSGSQYLPRFTGASATQYRTDDRYSSLIGVSPAELMQLYISVYNPTTTTVTTSMSVTLTYYTEFYDPVTVAQS